MELVIITIIGLCYGSFINVLIFRLPNKISILSPRSFCPKCNTLIPFYRNIPILSFLLQVGKCHQCNNKSDSHTNCANDLCHLLFIQCEECGIHYNRCCSIECSDYLQLSDEKKIYRKKDFLSYNNKRLKGRVKPKLYEILN